MKFYYIAIIIAIITSDIVAQEKLFIKNMYFFGDLDYTEDVSVCDEYVWVNVLNKESTIYDITNSIKKSSISPEKMKIESLIIGESHHKKIRGRIGVGVNNSNQYIIIYDPEIFEQGEEVYISDIQLFKYLLFAHEIAHIILDHGITCSSNLNNAELKVCENDADYHCGMILKQLDIKRSQVEYILNNDGVKRFLKSPQYNSVEERKKTILKGYDHRKEIEKNQKEVNSNCECYCPVQF